MKKFIEKLKSINLTLPLIGIVLAMGVIIVLLANYYGYIKVAGLQNWVKNKPVVEEQKSEEKTEGSEAEEPKAETPTPPAVETPQSSISLSGSAYATGVKLNWTTTGVDTSKGFKVVKSTSQNPVYPGNSAVYISQSTAKYYSWEIKDGKTYYFRVCQYTGSGCGLYSNNIKVTAPYVETKTENPTPPTNTVKSITLSPVGLLSTLKGLIQTTETPLSQYKVSWTVDGYSEKGFKLVWSKSTAPTYPTRSGDKYNYYSSPSQTYGVVDSFDGAGTYYVRVCEYLGGACGVYSNQIEVTLP